MDGPASAPVTVALLGPIAVHTVSAWVPVAGVKLQTLLALLALSTPRPVSDDRLIEELWGDEQPAKPANALQAQVSQLRRVLGPDVVTREGSGYALRIEPDEIDAIRLDRLVHLGHDAADNGEHRDAAAHFQAAVSLVRGPPLGDLLDLRFAREAASRLEQVAIAAHEGYIDAELASGHHADVVAQVTDLVAEHPLWERFHAQLMLALFRCGRQSDALRAYQQVRELLAEEMGLEPGPELRALERAVLSHDPTLAAPISLTPLRVPASTPTPLTSFIGRTVELAALAESMVESRLVTFVGPAGSGKTRLALEMATRLAPHRSGGSWSSLRSRTSGRYPRPSRPRSGRKTTRHAVRWTRLGHRTFARSSGSAPARSSSSWTTANTCWMRRHAWRDNC